MERQITNKLIKWKEYPFRKPLILTGIRQVGKTWTLKEFGRLHYDNTAYFNFGENEFDDGKRAAYRAGKNPCNI